MGKHRSQRRRTDRLPTKPSARRLHFETLEDRRVLALMISLPANSVLESAGTVTATITRTTGLTTPLTVSLTTKDPTAATVPATIQFSVNQASRTFPITVIDNLVVDASASATITATAPGHASVAVPFTVLNDDLVELTNNLDGDVLTLARGPQSGSHALEVGPALATGSASSSFASFGGPSTYQTAGTGITVQADEFIPVDTTKNYSLSGWAKSGDEFGQRYNPSNEQSFGVVSYDADLLPILPQHVLRFAGAMDTTLAMPLNPGDTTIRLTNAAGWSNGAGQSAATRALAWYGYQNSAGVTYANYTYTRKVATGSASGLWLPGAVSGNVITLTQPWAGPALPTGAAVRNATGGSDESFSLLDADSVPADWTWSHYVGTFGGGVLSNGNNSATLFRPGTAYIKPIITANEQGTTDNFISWRDVSVTQIAAATTPADLELPVIDLSVPAAGDQRSPLPFNAGSPNSWAGALVEISPTESYTLSGKATQSIGTLTLSADEPVLQFASLDIDQKLIHPLHVTKYAYAADTTLTVTLKPGDTSFLIEDASGWSNAATESAQTRALAWYGYTNSTGHTYADYTYTRNVAHDFDSGLWNPGAIRYDNAAGAYRVSLTEPWSGPTIAAGSAVRNAASGSLYNALVPTATVGADSSEYVATFGGASWQNGQPNAKTFRPGTAYIQPVFSAHVLWTDMSIGSQQDVTTLGTRYFPSPQVELASNGLLTLDLNVLGKDFFPGAPSVSILAAAAQHGTTAVTTIPGGQSVVRYTSPTNFVGTDVISYTVRNTANNAQVTATAAVTIRDAADDVVLERLRQIGVGMENYESVYDRFPVSGSENFDANGQPYLSWRVHILPFLGYQDLYDQFHLNEPWNSAHNSSLLSQMPDIFRSAGDAPNSTTTRFQTFTGPDAPFGNLPAGQDQIGPRLSSFADDLSQTLLVVEAGANTAVPWIKPDDLEFDAANPLAALGTITAPKINAVMADGSTIELLSTIDADTFKALVTPNDDEVVDAFELRREFAEAQGGIAAAQSYGLAIEDLYFINIALAMLNYEAVRQSFPVAGSSFLFDANGQPYLSWRVHILPYLGYANLYSQFHLDEPWNSEHNSPLLDQMPDIFRSAGDASDTTTTRVMTFTGPRAPFGFQSPGFLQTGPTVSAIVDGTSNTIMFVEAGADKAAPWTKPEDLPFDTANPLAALGNLLDGRIRGVNFGTDLFTLGADIAPGTFSALVTRSGANIDPVRYDLATIADREALRRGELEAISTKPNDFRNIAIAAQRYADARTRLPVDRVSTTGTPLLSWRVLILPYLEQQALYNQFHLDEPWDSPHNLSLLKYMPDYFRSAGDPADSMTTRVTTFTGPGAPFPTIPANNSSGPRLPQDITDGTSNTIMFVEAGAEVAIPWTKPSDTPFHTNNPFSPLGTLGNQFFATYIDSATRTHSNSISLSELAARITNKGGEDLSNPPIIPNVPGFYIRQSAGNTVTNEFGVDWFDVVLDRAPVSNVVLSLNTSASGIAVLDKNSLAFTAANWNVPQRVALRGIDNHAINDPQNVDITVAVVDAQSDASYHSVANQVFSALIVDDDLLPGDFNGNGTVNAADLTVWETAYGTNGAADADGDGDSDGRDFLLWQRNVVPSLPADFDGDSDVDGEDLGIWQSAYGENTNGDADHDGDSDGRDFLAWQRNYTPSATLSAGDQTALSEQVNAVANEDLIDAAIVLAVNLDTQEQDKYLPDEDREDALEYSAAVDEVVATSPWQSAPSTPAKSFGKQRRELIEPTLGDDLLDQLL